VRDLPPRTRAAILGVVVLLVCPAALGGASLIFLYGTHLFIVYPWPDKLWQWPRYLPFWSVNIAVQRWLKLSGSVAALGGAIVIARCAVALFGDRKRALHGNAKWASRARAEQSGIAYVKAPTGQGILLGCTMIRGQRHYLELMGQEHVSLEAKTRSGKGVSFVIPNCLAWGGSLLCLDVKGENYRATAGYRARLDEEVILFDPASADCCTHRWNPLSYVDRSGSQIFDQIQRAGFALFPENAQAREPYWDDASRSAFVGVGTIVAETPGQPLSIAAILRYFSGDSGDKLEKLIKAAREDKKPYSQAAIDAVSDYLNGDDRQVNGIRKTVTARLAIFYNPRIAAATETSDFDLRDIRRKRMSIFVSVAPGNIRRMRPLLALFFQQAVELNTQVLRAQDDKLSTPVLILLDEAVRVGKVPIVAEANAYVAQYGIRMAWVLQNKAQLRGLYGADGAEDILDNSGADIVFGTNDLKTCEEVSKRLGYDTLTVETGHRKKYSSLTSYEHASINTHQHRRALLLPQEIADLAPTQQIVIRAGMAPLKADRIVWYKDPIFQAMALTPPEVKAIAVVVALDDGKTKILPDKKKELQLSQPK